MAKDAGLRIRVERELRQRFNETCRLEGKTAADVLRRFMEEYVEQGSTTRQGDLFQGPENEKNEGNE